MKHLIVAILLLLPGLVLAQTPLKSGGNTKLIPGPGSRVSRQEVTNGIVGWWKLNEGTGTSAADSSGNGNTGTLTGGPTWTNALYGGLLALSFDGVNDYVTVPSSSTLIFGNGTTDSPYSFSLWFKTSSATGQALFEKDGWDGANWAREYQFLLDNGAIFIRNYNNGGAGANASVYIGKVSTATTFANGQWTHVVVTYSGSGLESGFIMYVNGAVIAAGSSSSGVYTAMNGTARPLAIGILPFSGGDLVPLLGSLDDVRIYNRALTLKEIQLLFTNNPNNTP